VEKRIQAVFWGIAAAFLCRELACWYLKNNELVALLEEQNRITKKLAPGAISGVVNTSGGVSFVAQTQKKCKRCGKTCDLDYSGCPYCGGAEFD
jgi:rRNA maturation endonuclease Nob1